jgi:Zn-dependent peptidase ImmA (M78 family)
MKTLREVIERELSTKKMSHKQLYEAMSVTEQAYFALLRRNSTKPASLEKIGKPLNISAEFILNQMYSDVEIGSDTVGYWKKRCEVFEQKYMESQNKIGTLVNTIQYLSLGKFRAVFCKPANTLFPFFLRNLRY